MAAIDGTDNLSSSQLRSLRLRLDWSLGYMCDELGLSGANATDTLTQMEQGRKVITGPISKLIDRIAREHNLALIEGKWKAI